MATKEEWTGMSYGERRAICDAFLVNLSTRETNPTSSDNFYLNKLYSDGNGNDYKIVKVTRNESRNITFFYSIKF